MISLIFATHNQHKADEVSAMIDKNKFTVQTLNQLAFHDEIEETADTLEGNALIKARTIHDLYKTNVFSEDTGLEIKALNNAPGVITARYAGPERDAQKNMDLVLEQLTYFDDRSAQFRAVIALIYEGKEYLFEGVSKGKIAFQKSGFEGFGYDPIFIPENHDTSFAEMSDALKNSMSHRLRALEKMTGFLETIAAKK